MSEHCWHRAAERFSNGAGSSWSEFCCWCGAKRHARTRMERDPEHGPRLPLVPVRHIEGDVEGRCPERPPEPESEPPRLVGTSLKDWLNAQ